jgi:hypothetical protein
MTRQKLTNQITSGGLSTLVAFWSEPFRDETKIVRMHRGIEKWPYFRSACRLCVKPLQDIQFEADMPRSVSVAFYPRSEQSGSDPLFHNLEGLVTA